LTHNCFPLGNDDLVLKDLSSVITYLIMSSTSCIREVPGSRNGDILTVRRLKSSATCTNRNSDVSELARQDLQIHCTLTVNDPKDVPGLLVLANLSSLLKAYRL